MSFSALQLLNLMKPRATTVDQCSQLQMKTFLRSDLSRSLSHFWCVEMCGVLALLLASIACASSHQYELVTVYLENSSYKYKYGIADFHKGLAVGNYTDGQGLPSNFGRLSIRTNENANATDEQQMYAMGFAEAALTHRQIFYEAKNLREVILVHYGKLPTPEPSKNLTNFLTANDKFVRTESKKHRATSPFWRGVGLVLAQFDGLMAGYEAAAPKNMPLKLFDFQLLNGVGDFFDLIPATTPSVRRNFSNMDDNALREYIFEGGRCSGLIKVLGDLSNIFFSHASWWSYNAMLRHMKYYYHQLQDPDLASTKMAFSSYPGFLQSLDDFYILSSGLVMVQTTNSLFNHSLYDAVRPESVLAWMRVRVANLYARTGEHWHKLMQTANSGTYENQYMVLDRNQFTPGRPLGTGTLWVGEQIPALYVYADVTPQLERGYWPSYNVPYFPEIYDRSGYPGVVKRLGPDHSYQLAPRAKIFRRDQGQVTDMTSMKRIMRYNDYEHDPYSNGNPDNAICARGDLRTPSPTPGGCLDTKVSDYFQSLKFEAEVVNGPTSTNSSYGPGQAPFDWRKFPKSPHMGQPTVFDFVFESAGPSWPHP